MAVDHFGYFGITEEVNSMPINSHGYSFVFSIGMVLCIFFLDLPKEIFNGLADWIIDKDPNIQNLENVNYGLRDKTLDLLFLEMIIML